MLARSPEKIAWLWWAYAAEVAAAGLREVVAWGFGLALVAVVAYFGCESSESAAGASARGRATAILISSVVQSWCVMFHLEPTS